ncbi:hypothetical protein I541_5439 [Mycobacteroides abscessus]|nr:hypothetical protein MA4S0726RB_4067 [Mycobacteroides abscessus 4S-0726-RB]EIV60712.1 hypothetical protein MA4S0116S_3614 [Mycobacteroides abscessus 4S-0116-S]EUA69174.1 hypothetical protein I541_5439 [Mycobacteroides abscessus]
MQSPGLNGSGSAGSAPAKAGANVIIAMNSAPLAVDLII